MLQRLSAITKKRKPLKIAACFIKVMMINDKEEQSEIIDVHILPKLNDLNLLSVRKIFQDCLAIDVDESLTMNFNIEASYQLLKDYKEMQRYDAGKKTTYVNLYTIVTVPVFERYSGAGKPKAIDVAGRLCDSNEAIKEIERVKQNIIVVKETISGSRSHLYYKQSPGPTRVFIILYLLLFHILKKVLILYITLNRAILLFGKLLFPILFCPKSFHEKSNRL
jgi:hypothetical protein